MSVHERAAALQSALKMNVHCDLLSTNSVFANDFDFEQTIAAATEHTPRPSDETTLALGIIVGNGYLTSALPELPIDAAVMLDAFPGVHSWHRHTKILQDQQPTPEAFLKVIDHTLPPDLDSTWRVTIASSDGQAIQPSHMLAAEARSVGKYHFLANQERYEQCRTANKAKPVIYVAADLTDEAAMNHIGATLRNANAEVTFLNMTNVAEYTLRDWPACSQNLNVLPINPQAFIAWATSVTARSGNVSALGPKARWSLGLDTYTSLAGPLLEPLLRFLPNL